MSDDEPVTNQVTSNEQFVQELMATYPEANTPSKAYVMAAGEAVYWRQTFGTDFESYVRALVRDELENQGVKINVE